MFLFVPLQKEITALRELCSRQGALHDDIIACKPKKRSKYGNKPGKKEGPGGKGPWGQGPGGTGDRGGGGGGECQSLRQIH